MDPGVWHQVGLELIQIHIESAVKPQRGSDGGHNLGDQTVEVGVGRPLDVQIPPADVIDGLVVHHEGAVRMLQRSVSAERGVVGLNNSGGDLKFCEKTERKKMN